MSKGQEVVVTKFAAPVAAQALSNLPAFELVQAFPVFRVGNGALVLDGAISPMQADVLHIAVLYALDTQSLFGAEYDANKPSAPVCIGQGGVGSLTGAKITSAELAKIGTPGGSCVVCPFNRYGTKSAGNGKACKQTKTLLVVAEGFSYLTRVQIPPGSLKAFGRYVNAFAVAGVKVSDHVTAIRVGKDNRMSFSALRETTPEEREIIALHHAGFKSLIGE